MDALFSKLLEFHKKFNIPTGKFIGDTTPDKQALHYKLMLEELNEFKDGCDNKDIVEIADGLGDVLFVLISSVVAHGLTGCMEEIFDEICNSNMSKLDKDGNVLYREDGKIMRGENYFKPRIADIIARHKSNETNMTR